MLNQQVIANTLETHNHTPESAAKEISVNDQTAVFHELILLINGAKRFNLSNPIHRAINSFLSKLNNNDTAPHTVKMATF